MDGFPFPAMMLPSMDGEAAGIDEICSASNPFDVPLVDPFEVRHVNLGFDPTGIASGVIGAVGGVVQAVIASKVASKQASLQEQALKAQKQNDARSFAVAQVQMQAASIQSADEKSRFGTYAIAGVLGGIGLIFVFSAIRTAAKRRDAKLKGAVK